MAGVACARRECTCTRWWRAHAALSARMAPYSKARIVRRCGVSRAWRHIPLLRQRMSPLSRPSHAPVLKMPPQNERGTPKVQAKNETREEMQQPPPGTRSKRQPSRSGGGEMQGRTGRQVRGILYTRQGMACEAAEIRGARVIRTHSPKSMQPQSATPRWVRWVAVLC